jgi:hypothetical protein
MASPAKSSDPLATPISAIMQKPVVNPRHEKPPIDEPMTYSQLAAQATAPPSMQEFSPVHEEPEMDTIEPVYQPQPEPVYHQPVQYIQQPPPPPQPQAMYRGGFIEEAPPAKKKSSFSIEANKNLLILLAVTAAVLTLAAPKLRTVPRFATTSGIGLNLQGVIAISAAIVLGYKAVTYAAGTGA